MVAFPSNILLLGDDGERGVWVTIWAFCLSTSAGVRMRHDTSSPVEDATA